jgi:hypothetical protein
MNIDYTEETEFLKILNISYQKYLLYGSRSSKKVDVIHDWIVNKLKSFFDNERYIIDVEQKVPTINSAGYKKCDVVVYDKTTDKFVLVIPVKFVCSNFKQNKNNYFENCVGDCVLLKLKNPELRIIPFNIFIRNCPYYTKNRSVKKIEDINLNEINSYEKLKEKNIFNDSLTYLVELDYKYNTITEINQLTPYKNIEEVIRKL